MNELSWPVIIVILLGNGFLLTLVTAAAAWITRRIQETKKKNVEADESIVGNLWKIIDAQKLEIKDFKTSEKLDRKTVMAIYTCVREIQNEMDSLNIMLLSDEETNVFARRWGNIKGIMARLTLLLSGDDDLHAKDSNKKID